MNRFLLLSIPFMNLFYNIVSITYYSFSTYTFPLICTLFLNSQFAISSSLYFINFNTLTLKTINYIFSQWSLFLNLTGDISQVIKYLLLFARIRIAIKYQFSVNLGQFF